MTPRLSKSALLRLLEASTLLEHELLSRDALAAHVARLVPQQHGLLFHDFLSCVTRLLTDVLHEHEHENEQLRHFWASLLAVSGRRVSARGDPATGRQHLDFSGAGQDDSGLDLSPSRGSWAGRLSDEILQNQEKLLAVLEHETAVVEKAVMEQASLKHAYPTVEHSLGASGGSNVGTEGGKSAMCFEYQCDPLFPPETASSSRTCCRSRAATDPSVQWTSPSVENGSVEPVTASLAAAQVDAKYANWYVTAQVRDVFLAFHTPLLELLVQYSRGQRVETLGNQYCLSLPAVSRMLEDLKLQPAFLSSQQVQTLFSRFCERDEGGKSSTDSGTGHADGLLTPQGLTLLLGSCALDLYARSLTANGRAPELLLSAREVLLSFFGDLGFLDESDVPPARQLCFVGMDVEAVLWPLFEYYASSSGPTSAGDSGVPPPVAQDARLGLTAAAFERFMAEIAGQSASDSAAVFRRVRREASGSQSRCKGGDKPDAEAKEDEPRDTQGWRMHLDEFYAALALVQTEHRAPGETYSSAGDAVRRWLQQTQ